MRNDVSLGCVVWALKVPVMVAGVIIGHNGPRSRIELMHRQYWWFDSREDGTRSSFMVALVWRYDIRPLPGTINYFQNRWSND